MPKQGQEGRKLFKNSRLSRAVLSLHGARVYAGLATREAEAEGEARRAREGEPYFHFAIF